MGRLDSTVTETQKRMLVASGYPWQFRVACMKAFDQGYITLDDARRAAKEYDKEWVDAERKADVAGGAGSLL